MLSTRLRRDMGKYAGMACLLCACVAGQCDPGVGSMVPGAQGPQGEPGAAGADGSLRVYGDGSAGDRVVSSDENWNSGPDQPKNLQFASLRIDVGVTLTVPSGMTIRVTGDFANHGTIVVLPAADGGFAGQDLPGSSDDLSSENIDPVAGIGTSAAQAGDVGNSGAARNGGRGGIGLSEFEARQLMTVTTLAGGGGAVGGIDSNGSGFDNFGSKGGGALRILAMGSIENANGAEIIADGEGGEGAGGGGGLIVLASMTSVDNTGAIMARGGDGEDSDTDEAPSGGGGGGIVHMLAPSVDNSGAVDVGGGLGGGISAGSPLVTSVSERFGGGGGGASGGDGGKGGSVPSGAPIEATEAENGEVGFSLVTEVDPTALL